jgi:collagen type III alpha
LEISGTSESHSTLERQATGIKAVATVSDKTQHSYADADEFIQYQLEKARNRIKATDLLTAGVLAGLLLVGYVLIFTLLDHWVIDGGFGAWTRAILLAVVLILCGAIVYRYVLRPWFRRINPLYAARMLDRSSGEIQGSLLALIDLQSTGHKSEEAIHRTLEKRAAVKLAEVHVDEVIDRRLLTRMGTGLFIVTLITCLYAVLSPKSISLLRPLTFASTTVATRTVIETVQPGNTTVPAGSQLEFVADLAGVIPEDVRVLYSTSDRRFVDEPLPMRTTDVEHRFRILMVGDGDRGIRQDITYRIEAGDARSEIFTISVEQPPTARVTEVRYVYPEYMNLPERTDSAGAIDAWEDTTLTIQAEASETVSEAVLQMSDDAAFSVRGEELQMKIKETLLAADWKLTRREDNTFPKFYRIQVTNPEGHKDLEPVVYPVDVRRDQPPTLKLIDPTRDLEVAANAIVPLLVEAEDPDFLLRSVTLHYAVNGKLIQPSEVLLDAFQSGLTKRWADTWEFRLKPLNLNPGDVVTFHLEARDNRPPLGNQSRTGDLNLQITAPVSEQQVKEQLAQDRQMQDQMHPQDKNDANNSQTNPGDNQAVEQPQTAENSAEPMPNKDMPNEFNEDQSPEPKDTDARNGQSKDPKNSGGQKKDDLDPGSNAEQSQTGEEQNQPGQQGASSRQQDRRTDDDKALQKIIERANREGKNSDDKSNGSDSKKEDRRTGSEDKKEREPGTSKDGNKSKPNNDDKPEKNSGSGEREGVNDANTPDKQNGNDVKDKPAGVGEEPPTNAAEPSDEAASNEQNAGDKKPTPGVEQSAEDVKTGDPDDGSKTGTEETRPGATGEKTPGDDTEAMEKNPPGDGTSEKPTDSDPAEKPTGDPKPGDDPAKPDMNELSDPKNTAGAPNSNEPSDDKSQKNSKNGGKDPDKSASDPENKTGDEQGNEKPGDNQKPGDPKGQEGSKENNKSGDDKPPMQNQNPTNMNSEAGRQSDPNKSGNEASKDSKSGDETASGEKSAGEKGAGEKGAGEKGAGEKGGGEKGGGEKGGGEKGGGEKGGGEKGGGEKGGGEKGGGEKGGGEKGGGEKGGGEKGGGEKGGGEKGGGEKGGGEKGGGEKGGGEKGGGEKGGGEKGGGEKGGGEKGGGEKGGGEKGGGEKGGGEKGGGEKGEGKSGGGGEGAGKQGEGESSSDSPGAGGEGGKGGKKIGRSEANTTRPDEDGEPGLGDGGMPDDNERSENAQPKETKPSKPADPQADDAASAAALAIKRLQKELDRGKVDPKLLDELGWTETEMKSFVDRMQKQLEQRELNAQQLKEKSISEKSFDAMLKGLDINSTGQTRQGRTEYDRDQQDTTTRQSAPPSRYKQLVEGYQRSVSGAKDNKP